APRLNELLEGRTQGQSQPEGQDDPGAVLIPPTEAARHREQMIVPEGRRVLQKIGGVHPDRLGPGQVQGEGGLVVAIEAVAIQHQSLRLWYFVFRFSFSVFGFCHHGLSVPPGFHAGPQQGVLHHPISCRLFSWGLPPWPPSSHPVSVSGPPVRRPFPASPPLAAPLGARRRPRGWPQRPRSRCPPRPP